jgi:protein SCO1
MIKKLAVILSLALLGPITGICEEAKTEIGIVEKLGHYVPGDVEFYDENGNLVRLERLIDRPTIIVPVYFRCTALCDPLLNEVVKVVDKMDLDLGKDYRILTVSFDQKDTPGSASDKRDECLGHLKKKVDPTGWRFLTGDSVNIHRLTDSLGFYFKRNGMDWIHPTALIAVSPQRKIARYLYGIYPLPLDVKLAVMEASEGKTGPAISKILNLCYTYDPEGKHYTFDFVRIAGVVVLGLLGVFVFVFIVRPNKAGRKGK